VQCSKRKPCGRFRVALPGRISHWCTPRRASALVAWKISVVIPCYNEQDVLPELFRGYGRAKRGPASGRSSVSMTVPGIRPGLSWWPSSSAIPGWRALVVRAQLSATRRAVSAGIYHASGDAVIVVDADLQDPPEELARFIEQWRRGYQVVYAVRQRRKEILAKRACYWLFYRLMRVIVPSRSRWIRGFLPDGSPRR